MEGNKALSLQFTGDLISHLIDKRATLTPNAVYAEYPVSALTYRDGYRKITYREMANAVNGAAKWLVDTLGAGQDFETLAYIGPNDVRYPVLILGAVKAGYKVSLRNVFRIDGPGTADGLAVSHIASQRCHCPIQSF